MCGGHRGGGAAGRPARPDTHGKAGRGPGHEGRSARGQAEGTGDGRRRRDVRLRPGDDRHGLQLRRTRLPGVRDAEVPDRGAEGERLHHRDRRRRHPHRVGREMGQRQAGHRARLGCGLHPAGVAEARRHVPRSDRGWGARSRRGSQLRHAAQHRGRRGGQAHHGAREAARHDHDLARGGRRTARHQGLLRALRDVQRRGPRHVQPRRLQPLDRLGRERRQRHDLGRVPVRRRDCPQRRRAVARQAAPSTPWS